MRDFRPEAAALRPEMVALRRDLHQYPELAFQEFRTAGIVAQELTKLGLEVQTGVGQTGVVAILEGAQEGETVMVRCDMDALPVFEENNHAFRSLTDQKMHACGHDGHITIGLGVAKLLAAHRDQLRGRVKFVFQPAEEVGRGAKAMLADGVLSDPTPSACFGLHVWPDLPVGEMIVSSGALMAGAGIFQVEVTGRGGHAARPHGGIDPIVAAAQMVTAIQSIVSRNLDPLEAGVVSVTQIQGGHAFNVIPPSAMFKGTFRTFNQAVEQKIIQRLETIVQNIAQAMDCQVTISTEVLVPPVYNNPQITQRLQTQFAQTMPDLTYHTDSAFKTMEAEDVAFFLEAVGGTFLLVGSGYTDKTQNYPLHHPRFDLNEDVLVLGAATLAAAVSDYVLP